MSMDILSLLGHRCHINLDAMKSLTAKTARRHKAVCFDYLLTDAEDVIDPAGHHIATTLLFGDCIVSLFVMVRIAHSRLIGIGRAAVLLTKFCHICTA